MKTNNTPIPKGKPHLSFIVISLFLSVLVVFKTSITIYMKWKKKDCKKQTNKKKSVMVFVFYFALVLHNSSG